MEYPKLKMKTGKEIAMIAKTKEKIVLGKVYQYLTEQNKKMGFQLDACPKCHQSSLQIGKEVCRCYSCKGQFNIFDMFRIFEYEATEKTIISVLSERYDIKSTVLNTVTATELLSMDLTPAKQMIENLLTAGTFLFSGAPKIGKSWLVLYLAIKIANGEPIWGNNTLKGSVLYLCLEDNLSRVQKRYEILSDKECSDLYFSIESELVGNGLEEQLNNFLTEHEDTSLIIIDTLQKVRGSMREFSYAMDYNIVSNLKKISDNKNIAIIIVHHTREMESVNVFDMISGTNGLLGAADGAFVLVKNDNSKIAKLSVSGRDIEDNTLLLEFDKASSVWNFKGYENDNINDDINPLLVAISELIKDDNFTGTASELAEKLNIAVAPNVLSRKLRDNMTILKNEYHINFSSARKADGRIITLSRYDDNDDESTPVAISENIDISS